ncbi:type IV pilus modification protein PilV [Marinobacter sp. CA1]|uniref:type IV pilus modification protein PilV n=1 Tax=Marinobacter sp. CA1 TaxID=2817656 RepID=UPI001D0809B1|nr:type IV pilus modification protein PilV [Marinobacter sp. CA1]UDL04374.1 type IV pilus modification protein PilV [Marinobacter sp. CA1]
MTFCTTSMQQSQQQGFTLVEVMVAVLILGIGLLGAAAIQLLSLQNINNAELRTQATLFAQELTELARTGAPADFVTSGGTTASCGSLTGRFEGWCEAMSYTLPGATFETSLGSGGEEFTVTITWPERIMYLDAASGSAAGEGTSSYTLITRL